MGWQYRDSQLTEVQRMSDDGMVNPNGTSVSHMHMHRPKGLHRQGQKGCISERCSVMSIMSSGHDRPMSLISSQGHKSKKF